MPSITELEESIRHIIRKRPREDQPQIHVKFRQVSHFSIEPRDPDVSFGEDESLSFVAYASPDSEVGEALSGERPDANMHLVFC